MDECELCKERIEEIVKLKDEIEALEGERDELSKILDNKCFSNLRIEDIQMHNKFSPLASSALWVGEFHNERRN